MVDGRSYTTDKLSVTDHRLGDVWATRCHRSLEPRALGGWVWSDTLHFAIPIRNQPKLAPQNHSDFFFPFLTTCNCTIPTVESTWHALDDALKTPDDADSLTSGQQQKRVVP